MRISTRMWLIIATILVVAGIVLFSVAMWRANFDFDKLGTGNYITNTYEISEDFNCLSLGADTASIVFALSEDGKCKVECYEEEKAKHTVFVEGDTLVIQLIDQRKWYDHIGIYFEFPRIMVYLPKAEYSALSISGNTGTIQIPGKLTFENVEIATDTGDINCFASVSGLLKIKTSTGKICVENLSVVALDLSVSTGLITVSQVNCQGDIHVQVSTGRANLTDTVCKNLTSNGDTGDIVLNRVIAAEKISVHRNTGDVWFDGSDAAEIFVETDTGDVIGSLLTAKVFVASSDTGRVNVPESAVGGRCEIHTDTGNIKITIP